MSPMRTEILDHDIVYEYQCLFIVGTLEQIRAAACAPERRPGAPQWRFASDRQHWTRENASDEGWDLDGSWELELDERRAALTSPFTFWRAGEAPALHIRAGFATQGPTIRLFWRELAPRAHTTASWQEWQRTWWVPERSLSVPIQNDGVVRDVAVDLSEAASYRGALCGLRIELPESEPGDTVQVERIALTRRTLDAP
jgi:hypothetical protein